MKINLITSVNGALIGMSFGSEREITVGRELGNSISPIAADGVSRHHGKIFAKNGEWFVEDFGSTNGTFVEDKKITGPTKITANTKLQFGRFEVRVDAIVKEDGAPVHSTAAATAAALAAPPASLTATVKNAIRPVPTLGPVPQSALSSSPSLPLPIVRKPAVGGVAKPAAAKPAAALKPLAPAGGAPGLKPLVPPIAKPKPAAV